MSKMKTEKRNTNNRTESPDTKLVSRKLLLNRETLRTLSAQVLEEVVGGEGPEELTLVHPRTFHTA